MDYENLINLAIKARESSYSPYSGFSVGASVLCKNGKIYTGCNIESSAYSETICAERVALSKAISEGERDFVAIAVVGGKDSITSFTYPCGACRQFLSELCPQELEIVLFNGIYMEKTTLGELLPKSFNRSSIV